MICGFDLDSAPPGASTALANSERCPTQAFSVGEVAWGTQFHPEALASTVQEWAGGDTEALAELGLSPSGLVTDAIAAEPDMRATWGPLADRWLALCTDGAAFHHTA